MNKKSPFWKYFSIYKDDSKYVVCALCEVKLSRGGQGKNAGTSCMKNHLKNKHSRKFAEIFSVTSNDPPATSPVFVAETPTRPNGNVLKEPTSQFDYLIGEMIALDKEPISIVERAGFNRLLKIALPKYNVPTRTYMAKEVLPEIHDRIRAKIRDRISNAPKLTITSDEWTCNGRRFMSLTAHWLSTEFELQRAILNTQQYLGYNTEGSIVNKLDIVADTWYIPIEKIHILVHNCEIAVKNEVIPAYATAACFIRSLHRIVSESLMSQPSVTEMLTSARRIVMCFNNDALAQDNLVEKSLQLPKKQLLAEDIDTRWISTYYMLERLIEQKRDITEYSKLTPNQWNLIEQYITLLKPFEVLAKITSSGIHCVSKVIPNIVTLLKYLKKDETGQKAPHLLNFIAALETEMQSMPALENETFLTATFLDPRFKASFLTSEQTERVQQRILTEVRNTEYTTSSVEPPPSKKKREEAFWDCFDEATNQTEGAELTIEHEVDFYSKSGRIDRRGDPYAWWSANSKQYPCLSRLARIYLASPCSSIYEESLYSKPGLDYENKRSQLEPIEDAKLMFIHDNLPLVDFEY